MRWLVEFEAAAAREFKKLDRPVREAIAVALGRLADEARDEASPYTNVRKLAGAEGMWRLRVGDYRVIFRLEAREDEGASSGEVEMVGVVLAVKVGHRREVYRGR